MSDISTIQYTFVPISVLDTKGHRTGHVHLYLMKNGRRYAILGHNKEHDNIASLGGFSNDGETLSETILRVYGRITWLYI